MSTSRMKKLPSLHLLPCEHRLVWISHVPNVLFQCLQLTLWVSKNESSARVILTALDSPLQYLRGNISYFSLDIVNYSYSQSLTSSALRLRSFHFSSLCYQILLLLHYHHGKLQCYWVPELPLKIGLLLAEIPAHNGHDKRNSDMNTFLHCMTAIKPTWSTLQLA